MTNKKKRAVAKELQQAWHSNWQYYYNENSSYNDFTTMLRKKFQESVDEYEAILVGGAYHGDSYYAVFKDKSKGLESPSFELHFYKNGDVRVAYDHNYAEELREANPYHPSLKMDDIYATHRLFLDQYKKQ